MPFAEWSRTKRSSGPSVSLTRRQYYGAAQRACGPEKYLDLSLGRSDIDRLLKAPPKERLMSTCPAAAACPRCQLRRLKPCLLEPRSKRQRPCHTIQYVTAWLRPLQGVSLSVPEPVRRPICFPLLRQTRSGRNSKALDDADIPTRES